MKEYSINEAVKRAEKNTGDLCDKINSLPVGDYVADHYAYVLDCELNLEIETYRTHGKNNGKDYADRDALLDKIAAMGFEIVPNGDGDGTSGRIKCYILREI